MFAHMRSVGAQVGITFGNLTLLSNSHVALQASEFAKEHGLFNRFHEEIFRAYFNEGKDIGSLAVVIEVATAVGIDAEKLEKALEQGTYTDRLQEMRKQAEEYGVSAVPTFIVNGTEKIVGVKSVEEFREVLAGMQ